MSKPFFEVFPSLQLNTDIRDLMGQTEVERVSATKRRDFLRVYLKSTRLIQKADIWTTEQEIKKQLFPQANLTVKIYEKFELSSQYNPEKLMDIYKESILEEFREYSHIQYNALKTAKIEYPSENEMLLTLEDTVLNHSMEGEILQILEKILVERCGFSVKIHTAYVEKETGRFQEEEEAKIRLKVDAIYSRTKGRREEGEQTASAEGSGQSTAQDPETGKAAETAQKPKTENAGGVTKSFQGGSRGEFKRGEFKKGEFRKGGNFEKGALKRSDNPDVIYGRDFEEEAMKIEELIGEMGEVVIRGKVLSVDTRDIKNEKTIIIFNISDFTDTMTIKMFVRTEQVKEVTGDIKPGAFLKVKGICMMDKFDHELAIGSIAGIKKIPDFTNTRMDTSARKRVELHCHTKMSDMDGVSEAKDIVKRAYKWGHRAIAITDHGVVQSFTDANHVWDDLWKAEKGKRKEAGDENPDKQDFFKIIYGVEAYLVDDLKEIVTNDKGQSLHEDYVVFDIETTGFSPVNNRIIEIGAVKVSGGEIVDRFSTFVNPDVPIPFEIEKLTSIRDEDVMDSPQIDVILPQFLQFCEGCIMVAHNASFDMSFIMENCRRLGYPQEFTYVDTVGISRVLLKNQSKHTLDAVAKTLGISLENHHRAVDDAECTAHIFVKFIKMLEEQDIHNLTEVNALGASSVDAVKKMPSYHAIILAKNDLGRINLYRLVSQSHLTYFNKHPRIPKSLILKYREGLILGSACEAGELYRALLDGQSDAQIARLVKFYDYLEIQPCGNNKFMIASEKIRTVNSIEDIQNINRRIVELGEQFHKPVVATCDVHFLDPEDEVYRRIIMAGRGFDDADEQAPLFLHTTEEMLEEFSYLGSDKAEEIVITNTNMIADMIETIAPVRPDKCPPVIPDSDKTLTEICYNRAHEIYGPDLPQIVEARLEKELNSIIKNGFAVMYIIAQKLVWKSVEDGYLVGSRGSVGSSFVATMAGITEVNPLSPHYYCSKCHYVDFDSEEVKAYAGKAGIDMPDKVCPVCGEKLHKDGFDIPFETFLGFKGDKEPDIDLNFSGMYQSNVHRYTEELFGKENVFKAGTVSGLQDKTAYGYVKKYLEERGKTVNRAEENRLCLGCTGVKRTTGQHPGGMVVVPSTFDIYDFCAIQHPADDVKGGLLTTHFEFKYLHDTLLKLDELGHDVPTFYKFFEEYSGIPIDSVPMNDPKVYSLLTSTEALGVTPEQIGSQTGTFGIPEMGTNFVRGMLLDAKPKNFSELIQISGLSHGTDVWTGNADELIRSGTCTIAEVIGCRDSIMLYLLRKGLEPKMSFDIMEAVRKGKVAKGGFKPGWEEAMKEHDVPDWYIESCRKIKYMFPKAHAVAYLMAAIRLMWFKVYHPAIFYAVYFTVRGADIDYEAAVGGVRVAKEHLRDNEKIPKDERTAKDDDALVSLQLVNEMLQRGCQFLPIELGKSYASKYVVEDGKVRLPFTAIRGLGEAAAVALEQATIHGQEYISVEELQQASGVAQSVFDKLHEVGALGNLPETSQVDLFSLM